MRINYYEFPEETPLEVLRENDCSENDLRVGGISVTAAKTLLKKYGGMAWTDHCERDGGVFETTEIELKGNNSQFKYNHHL